MSNDHSEQSPSPTSDTAGLGSLLKELMTVVNSQIDQLEAASIASMKREKGTAALQERNAELAASLRFLASAQLTGESASELRANIRKEVSRVFTLPEAVDT